MARVKNWRPPSRRRAASNSCVRATPSFSSNSRAEHVLAAVAARERKIGRAIISSARQIGDQQRVFIVRMRRDVQHAAHFAETFQFLENGRRGIRRSASRRAGSKWASISQANHEAR